MCRTVSYTHLDVYKRQPFYFPSFVLNTFSVKAFNFLYFNKQRKKEVKNFVDYETFFYPLDAINDWNKIYGKGGFIPVSYTHLDVYKRQLIT